MDRAVTFHDQKPRRPGQIVTMFLRTFAGVWVKAIGRFGLIYQVPPYQSAKQVGLANDRGYCGVSVYSFAAQPQHLKSTGQLDVTVLGHVERVCCKTQAFRLRVYGRACAVLEPDAACQTLEQTKTQMESVCLMAGMYECTEKGSVGQRCKRKIRVEGVSVRPRTKVPSVWSATAPAGPRTDHDVVGAVLKFGLTADFPLPKHLSEGSGLGERAIIRDGDSVEFEGIHSWMTSTYLEQSRAAPLHILSTNRQAVYAAFLATLVNTESKPEEAVQPFSQQNIGYSAYPRRPGCSSPVFEVCEAATILAAFDLETPCARNLVYAVCAAAKLPEVRRGLEELGIVDDATSELVRAFAKSETSTASRRPNCVPWPGFGRPGSIIDSGPLVKHGVSGKSSGEKNDMIPRGVWEMQNTEDYMWESGENLKQSGILRTTGNMRSPRNTPSPVGYTRLSCKGRDGKMQDTSEMSMDVFLWRFSFDECPWVAASLVQRYNLTSCAECFRQRLVLRLRNLGLFLIEGPKGPITLPIHTVGAWGRVPRLWSSLVRDRGMPHEQWAVQSSECLATLAVWSPFRWAVVNVAVVPLLRTHFKGPFRVPTALASSLLWEASFCCVFAVIRVIRTDAASPGRQGDDENQDSIVNRQNSGFGSSGEAEVHNAHHND
ncbi:uncharacterized protein CLUP02_06031 [Colletotrichum lupini]|uniref:Uncharacterized protein n=1 Tax=Colletotrichum lupini TaxID=145971 RepID=A0A9Q8SNK6_9PEZI|nr:uncharacterized protein CLUP02_06031 [Colletotrichum lupini]UQC80548.1 hypothetical protein CLUP02_06031 [Colletotrichum lupini]